MRSTKTLLLIIFGAILLTTAMHASALGIFTATGQVTDANWNPIHGAKVTLYDYDFNVVSQTVTDVDGYFDFVNINMSGGTFTTRVSVVDGGGEHKIPGYYFKYYPTSGDRQIPTEETHYDDYYIPGSTPHISPTPAPPVPTATPDPTPAPATSNDNSIVTELLVFVGGFIAGGSFATLVCFISLRSSKKP